MSETISMTPFETQSQDGTHLRGYVFKAPNTVRAVVSLVHGFGEHGGRYVPMAEAFAKEGIATVSLDLRGHGLSDGKRGVCEKYRNLHDDLSCLLQKTHELYSNVPHILYGHSMGGGLVIHYGLRSPNDDRIDAFIATGPLLTLSKPPGVLVSGFVRILRRLAPNLTLGNKIDGKAVSTLPDQQAAYENDPLNHGNLGVGLAVDMVDAGQWSLDNAHKWRAPLLILHARNDILTACSGSEAFAEVAQNTQCITFDGVAHEIHNDTCRQDVYTHMISFIKSFT